MKDLKDVVRFRMKWFGRTWSSRVWRWSLRQKLHGKIGSALRWDKTDLEICWICWMLRRTVSFVLFVIWCYLYQNFWITEGGPITLCISQCWSSLPGQGVELDLWNKSIESIESIQIVSNRCKSFQCFHCPFEPFVSLKKPFTGWKWHALPGSCTIVGCWWQHLGRGELDEMGRRCRFWNRLFVFFFQFFFFCVFF